MKGEKFPFSYNGTEYIIWAWKGDYIGLGAGAELGIYYGGDPHWSVDKSLTIGYGLYVTVCIWITTEKKLLIIIQMQDSDR